jgi:DNA-binding beta-propeller fold protein YncE
VRAGLPMSWLGGCIMSQIRVRTALAAFVVAAGASSYAGASELRKIQATHLESQFFLEYPEAVVVSPDGANVYTVSASTGGDAAAVHAFARASDGTLSPIGSLAMGNPGAVPLAIAISPDGRDVYAQAFSARARTRCATSART